jgi:hypothetical protein
VVPAILLFATNELGSPLHIVAGVAVEVTTGLGLTVTVMVSVAVQPAGDNPATVYMVVAAGVTVTGEPAKESGNHPKSVPTILLLTVKVEEAPSHIEAGVAVGVKTGLGLTVTVTVAVPEHPVKVPVTV